MKSCFGNVNILFIFIGLVYLISRDPNTKNLKTIIYNMVKVKMDRKKNENYIL